MNASYEAGRCRLTRVGSALSSCSPSLTPTHMSKSLHVAEPGLVRDSRKIPRLRGNGPLSLESFVLSQILSALHPAFQLQQREPTMHWLL